MTLPSVNPSEQPDVQATHAAYEMNVDLDEESEQEISDDPTEHLSGYFVLLYAGLQGSEQFDWNEIIECYPGVCFIVMAIASESELRELFFSLPSWETSAKGLTGEQKMRLSAFISAGFSVVRETPELNWPELLGEGLVPGLELT